MNSVKTCTNDPPPQQVHTQKGVVLKPNEHSKITLHNGHSLWEYFCHYMSQML